MISNKPGKLFSLDQTRYCRLDIVHKSRLRTKTGQLDHRKSDNEEIIHVI